jgi:hypothetical protein
MPAVWIESPGWEYQPNLPGESPEPPATGQGAPSGTVTGR